MKFGIHHASWLDSPDSAEIFETTKAKAQWAEERGFDWFSVMDDPDPGVGPPEEPILEGWTVLAALASVTNCIRLATLVKAVGYRNAGIDLLIQSDGLNDTETRELFVSDVMRHFA